MGSPWIIWEPASLWEKRGGEARQEGYVKTRQRLVPGSPRLRNTCCIRRWRGQDFSSGASRVSMTPSIFWMWTSRFQTWESINFSCFKPLSLWWFITAAVGNCACRYCSVDKLCATLCDPVGYSTPVCSTHRNMHTSIVRVWTWFWLTTVSSNMYDGERGITPMRRKAKVSNYWESQVPVNWEVCLLRAVGGDEMLLLRWTH